MTTSSQLHTMAQQATAFDAARLMMVEGQIRPNKVTQPALLDRLELIPREMFVEPGQERLAYREGEAPASRNRYLLAPMLLARMIEALDIQPGERVLDIAPASGYSTAILTGLTANVTALEADATLSQRMAQILSTLGIVAQIAHGPLTMGAKENAPYDAILVNGAVAAEPPGAWLAQLNEGGRLIVVVGGEKDLQPGRVTLYRRFGGSISSVALFESGASTLPGFAAAESFVF